MVVGVTDGYEKKLEIVGVGYRVLAKGTDLEFALGYSHPVTVDAPEGITFTVESPTRFARRRASTSSRSARSPPTSASCASPSPYKGKGVRYAGEHVRRKVGKAGK